MMRRGCARGRVPWRRTRLDDDRMHRDDGHDSSARRELTEHDITGGMT